MHLRADCRVDAIRADEQSAGFLNAASVACFDQGRDRTVCCVAIAGHPLAKAYIFITNLAA